MEINQATLCEWLRYDEDEGTLYWIKGEHAGKRALATINKKGYNVGSFFGRQLRACRVIWIMVKGYDPVQIDHDDGDYGNDKLWNLFDVTNAQNGRNRSIPSNNKSGVVGVSWSTRSQKWRAAITFEGQRINIGEYDDKEVAIAKRKQREVELGFHPNHGRRKIGV